MEDVHPCDDATPIPPSRHQAHPLRASIELLGGVVVLMSCLACSDDAPKEWVNVTSGTLVGSGVTALSVDAQGNFIGVESTLGVVASGSDPTKPWTAVPELADLRIRTLGGTLSRHPLAFAGGSVFESTPKGWVNRGTTGSDGSAVGAGPNGQLILARAGDFPGTPFTSPAGELYSVDSAPKAGEIRHVSGGQATGLLGERGCPGAFSECLRSVGIIGFDQEDALYAYVTARDETHFTHEFHKYAKGQWTKLPDEPPVAFGLGHSCSVNASGAIYCQHTSPEPEGEGPDQSSNLFRLGPGASEWKDLGGMPATSGAGSVIQECHIVARNDGRVAATCGAIGNGDDVLWVSTR